MYISNFDNYCLEKLSVKRHGVLTFMSKMTSKTKELTV